MAKRLNKKLTIGLTAAFFVLTTAFIIFALYSMQPKDPAPYMERARKSEHDRRFDEASRYYFQAYLVANKDPQYLLYMGDSLVQSNEEQKALQAWIKAVTDRPDLQEGWERIIKLYLEISELFGGGNLWQEVGRYAGELLTVNPQNALGLHARGRSLLALRADKETNAAEGQEALEKAVAIAPENVDFAYDLALRYLELKRKAEDDKLSQRAAELNAQAENVLKRNVELNTQPGTATSEARAHYAAYLAGENRDQEALALYDGSLALAGDDPLRRAKARVEFARYWLLQWQKLRTDPEKSPAAQQAFDKMTELLEQAAQADPDSFDPAFVLCSAYIASSQTDRAIEVARKRLASADISRQGMHGRLAKFARYQLLLALAEWLVGKAEPLPATSAQRAELLSEAQKNVDEADTEIPKTGLALHLAGRVQLVQGDHARALELFQRADAAFPQPNWLNDKLLALLLSERQQTGEALKHIEQAVRDSRADVVCWALYAQLLLSNNKYQQALDVADRGLKKWKDYPDLLSAKMVAYQRLDKPELAQNVRQHLEEVQSASGGSASSGALLNVLAMQNVGRVEDAIAAVEELLKVNPSDLNTVHRAVNLYMTAKRTDDARRVARRALELDPENELLQRMNTLIDILGDPQLSEAQRSDRMVELIERAPDPLDRAQQKAGWFIISRKWDNAFELLKEAERLCGSRAASAPARALDLRLRQIIDQQFNVALEMKDAQRDARLDELARRAVELDIDGLGGLTYRGLLHLARSESEQAISDFKQALERQPANSRVLTLLGRAYLVAKKSDDARDSFSRAIDMNPNEAEAHIFLARLARDLGEDELLQRELDVCQRLAPENEWIKKQLLERKELDAPEEAIPRREAQRAADPKDVENLRKLARLYLRSRRLSQAETLPKAEACYADAHQADPANAAVMLEWSNFLHAIGRADDALKLLEQFVSAAADNEHRALGQLMIGQHYRQTGDVPLASAAFLAAAELYPDTRTLSAAGDHFLAIGQIKPAADWYSRAIDKTAAEKSPHERRLRRQLLNVLLTLTDFDRARTEDENYVKLYPGDPFGLLMRAELEFRGGHVDEAIRITDGIIEKDTTYADAIFARARFQLTIGRWDRAIADLERLKAMAPEYRGLTPRRTLSYLYERTGQMEKAEFELRSLAERYPEMPEAADALIDFYKRQQRSGDAQHVATTWINRLPEDIRQAPWYLKRAELLLQTNDHARALEDLQKACELTKNDPRTVAAYMGVCQRLNRVDEGIKFYEAHSTDETRTPDLRVAYANILVRKGDLEGAVREYRAAVSGGRPEDLVQALAVARAAATAMGAARALELFRVTPDDPAQVLPNEFMVAALTSLSGDRSGAIEQLKGLLAKAEHDVVRWSLALQIGALCAEEGDNQAARHYYEETLRLNPNSLAGLNNLAYVLTDALHEPLKAIPYARKAVQLAPIAEVHDTLGWAYFKAGQLDEALGALSQAVQLDPELTAAFLHLADVYRCRGDFARAESLLRDTLQRIAKTPEEAKYQQQISDALKRVEQKDTKP